MRIGHCHEGKLLDRCLRREVQRAVGVDVDHAAIDDLITLDREGHHVGGEVSREGLAVVDEVAAIHMLREEGGAHERYALRYLGPGVGAFDRSAVCSDPEAIFVGPVREAEAGVRRSVDCLRLARDRSEGIVIDRNATAVGRREVVGDLDVFELAEDRIVGVGVANHPASCRHWRDEGEVGRERRYPTGDVGEVCIPAQEHIARRRLCGRAIRNIVRAACDQFEGRLGSAVVAIAVLVIGATRKVDHLVADGCHVARIDEVVEIQNQLAAQADGAMSGLRRDIGSIEPREAICARVIGAEEDLVDEDARCGAVIVDEVEVILAQRGAIGLHNVFVANVDTCILRTLVFVGLLQFEGHTVVGLEVMVHDELDIFSRLDDSGVGVATLQRICRIVEDLSACKAFAITRRVEDDLTQFDELVDGRQIATIPVDRPTDNAVAPEADALRCPKRDPWKVQPIPCRARAMHDQDRKPDT